MPKIRAINIDSDWFYRKGGKFFYLIADKSLNRINAFAHKSLIAGATDKLCKMAKEGPSRAMILVLTPIWELSGVSSEQQTDLKKSLRDHVDNGVFPIGITAFLSVVLLGILFFF